MGYFLIDKIVVIIFDDGYKNNYEEVVFILEKFGYLYIIFVNFEFIDEGKSYVMIW